MSAGAAGPGRDALLTAFVDSFVRLQCVMGSGFSESATGIHACATGLPIAEMNEIWVSDEAPDGAAIERAVARMRDTGAPFVLHGADADEPLLAEVAAAAGLSATRPQTLLAIDHLVEVAAPNGLSVTEIDGDGVDAIRRVAARGFDTPADLTAEMYPTGLYEDEAVHGYVGWLDGTATSVGLSVTATAVAPVFGVATDPGFRRRGHAAAVMARIVGDALSAGARWVALEPSEEGWPLYRALGFVEVASWSSWTSETS